MNTKDGWQRFEKQHKTWIYEKISIADLCHVITFLLGILYLLRTLSTFCRCFSRILFDLSFLNFSSLIFCTISSSLKPSMLFPESRWNLKKNQRWKLLQGLLLASLLISQPPREIAISEPVLTWSVKTVLQNLKNDQLFDLQNILSVFKP